MAHSSAPRREALNAGHIFLQFKAASTQELYFYLRGNDDISQPPESNRRPKAWQISHCDHTKMLFVAAPHSSMQGLNAGLKLLLIQHFELISSPSMETTPEAGEAHRQGIHIGLFIHCKGLLDTFAC